MNKRKTKSWIVQIRAVVTKEIVTTPCTEEEARNHPYSHLEDERETSQPDYTVTSVEPNE